MASPLSIFRKYEYILLVVFGCMLMIAFVVAPPILEYQRSSYRGSLAENATVVSWKNGSLTARELDSLVLSRNLVRSFLNVLLQRTMEQNGSPRVPPVLTVVTEESVVRTMLLADEARRLGLEVSDQAIMRYLEQLTGELIPLGQIGLIFRESLGDRMTEEQMFDVLRQELLAQNYMVMLHPDLFLSRGASTPPLADWKYFLRLHRRVKLELVALKAEQFKSVLDERGIAPTEEQIAALYEAGKDRFPNPQSPEPGFKRRPRIAFQYVRGDLNAFIEKEMEQALAAVSDEEVEKFYEENKERYRILDLPSEQDTADDSAGGEDESDTSKPDEAKPDMKPDSSSSDEPAAPSDEPAEEKGSAEPAEPQDESGEPKAEPAPQPKDPQSRRPGDDTVFVAMVQNEEASPEAPPEPTEEAEEESSEAPASAEKASDEPAEKGTPEEQPSESTPQEQPPSEAASSDDAKPAEGGESEEGQASVSDEKEPAARYKPLDEELRKEIREEIAREKAREIALEKLERALSEVRREVDKYARRLRREKEADVPPLDIESFAAERSLQAGETPLVDVLEVREYELGRSFEITAFSWPPQRQEFIELAYREGEPLYSPSQIQGEVRDIYFLYWKTREKEAYVPELDEIRDEVIDAWKAIEAFKLAEEKAQEIVAEAQKAAHEGKTLKDIVGDDAPYEVSETEEFSWLTTGFTPMGMSAPRLSDVEGVESPGEEFMKAVFSLKVGEVGWAPNQPRTYTYVFRILSETPGEEILRMIFLQMGNSQEIQQIAAMDRENHLRKWYEEFDEAHELKWHRTPRA